jgi:hypothetical protein
VLRTKVVTEDVLNTIKREKVLGERHEVHTVVTLDREATEDADHNPVSGVLLLGHKHCRFGKTACEEYLIRESKRLGVPVCLR